MRAVLDGLLERLEHIEIIFARSTLCNPPYKTASIRFLCIQEILPVSQNAFMTQY
jgi:hypothetical protein